MKDVFASTLLWRTCQKSFCIVRIGGAKKLVLPSDESSARK
jgi:hypothetical protein